MLTDLLLSSSIVHTTGINWESVAAIAAVGAILQAGFFWVIARRDKVRSTETEQTKQEIAGAVNHLSEVLLAKLETKETVSAINARLSRVEGAVNANRP